MENMQYAQDEDQGERSCKVDFTGVGTLTYLEFLGVSPELHFSYLHTAPPSTHY